MDAWLHVLDAVVELPAHLLREGGGEGLEAVVHHPHHHRVPGGQGRHGAFVGLRGEGAAARVGGGVVALKDPTACSSLRGGGGELGKLKT